ncbi:outer membrane lipoprotein-sorting protein [Shivajiella indica]|uniref:Outer membrane lipoprotein-sorting protein n=1 Tax=Shivajiella indica TaxID=872115 RepID=A0ABW5B3U8_9BACT
MKTFFLIHFTFLFIFYTLSAYSQSAKEIVEKMDKKMRGETIQVDMEMEIVRPRFTRTIGIKSWGKGKDYSMILITSPARDKGTSFLKRQKEIWNWVPTIERTIKLPPSMMSQSWMGSDFTNDDLVKESSVIDDYEHSILRTEKFNDFDCYLIQMIPKPEAAVVFGKILVWITKDSFVELKVENYDEYGSLVSTIKASEIKKMDDREIPTLLEMVPADKPGQKTILKYNIVLFNRPLEDNFFTVQSMKDLK